MMDRFGMHPMARTVLRAKMLALGGFAKKIDSPLLYNRVWSFGCQSMPWMLDMSMQRMALMSIL